MLNRRMQAAPTSALLTAIEREQRLRQEMNSILSEIARILRAQRQAPQQQFFSDLELSYNGTEIRHDLGTENVMVSVNTYPEQISWWLYDANTPTSVFVKIAGATTTKARVTITEVPDAE